MGIVKKHLGINVLEAANIRIKNLFKSGCKVYLSVSGGKDSIVMMSLCYDLIQQGEINPKQLVVQFIDEEVIYDCVVDICKAWRKRFMLIGVKYEWYCIEHRNNNCFNALENNENFIPWDRYEQGKWARPMPEFASKGNKYLVPRIENYQDFLTRNNRDGISIIGVRAAESLNRYKYIAEINSKGGISGKNIMYPIQDWKDEDIWKYIKDKNLDFPEVYLKMWEAGINKKHLRVCNLFAIDTCRSLTAMFEVYPKLWEAILRREPNAYLVRLYWDTEMFHRSSRNRKKLEKDEEVKKDYKSMLLDVVKHPKKYFKNPHALKVCSEYRGLVMRKNLTMTDEHWKKLYEAIMAGDTKTRTLRAIKVDIDSTYLKDSGVNQGYLKKGAK